MKRTVLPSTRHSEQNQVSADADRLRKDQKDNAKQDGSSGNLHRGVCDERGGADDSDERQQWRFRPSAGLFRTCHHREFCGDHYGHEWRFGTVCDHFVIHATSPIPRPLRRSVGVLRLITWHFVRLPSLRDLGRNSIEVGVSTYQVNRPVGLYCSRGER